MKADNFGWPQSARTADASLCERMTGPLQYLELEAAIHSI
jgi:hypothetical protein